MSVDQVAAAHQRRRVAIARRAAAAADKLWRRVDPQSIAPSWRANVATDVFATVAAAQGIAAAGAGLYVDDALTAQGVTAQAAGEVRTAAFAGVASDGRDLAGLLQWPAFTALRAIGGGASVLQAMALGRTHLDMIVRTQVADAGRAADGVAIAARPQVGYVRMVSAGACSRCIVLAGRWYRYSSGFLRHPACSCTMVPAREDNGDDVRTDPRKTFDAMSQDEQDRTFTKAGAQAVRDGADLAKVVNARRGVYSAGGRLFTHEAAGPRPRLMPEQLYRDATDRDDAVRLLRLHGFITA